MQRSLEDFGQLFMLAFDGTRLPSDVAEFFRSFRIGGVVLFADNFRSPEQLAHLVAEIQRRCAPPDRPLFVATDHEGGRVQRFREGFTRLPPMAEMGAGDPEGTAAAIRRAARELAETGIDVVLAPVADLCAPDRPGAIGDRSFGTHPSRVAEHVRRAVESIQGEGLLACVKHFPGHGATDEDSHRTLPVVTLGGPALEARDLVPFRVAIEAGVGCVMTAHVLYPQAGDAEWPASLSPYWQQEVLRRRLGFDGLIVTDAIEMKALLSRWSPTDCGLQALRSGADVLLYYKEADQYEAFDDLRRAFERGALDPGLVAESLARVRRAKAWLRRGRGRPGAGATAP